MSRARIAVLASGGGSNLQALLDYLAALGERRAADVVLVATDRPDAGALLRAQRAGIEAVTTKSRLLPDAQPVSHVLMRAAPDVVALAGYLQLIPGDVTHRFHGRMVNVHPAPLPSFGGPGMYGARVHRAVIFAAASHSGPTVHFVDDQYDHGTPIAHWPVPVFPNDDHHTLATRVLRAEHVLYPRVVHALAAGEIALAPDGHVSPSFLTSALPVLDESLDDDKLASIVESHRA